MNYDITFCSAKCDITTCIRNMINAPKNVPISVADLKDSEYCGKEQEIK